MAYIEVNFSVGMEFPKWVERIADYVWSGDDSDEDSDDATDEASDDAA